MAMYQAKTRGLGYQIFDAKTHARALERMHLEIDMKRAIERKQIQLHYQPIISLETGHLAGFEALARWNHNGRGAISPAQFIPLAEETGLVGQLSHSLFREACEQMRHWREQFPLRQDCFISVNVSSKQVSHGGLIDELDQVLRGDRIGAAVSAPRNHRNGTGRKHARRLAHAGPTKKAQDQALPG